MKIATWNINGIRAHAAQFLEWVAKEAPDVVCLQEIKASPAQASDVISDLTDLRDYMSYWHGSEGGYSGVSLHLRRGVFPASPTFSHPAFDHETRIVEATIGDQAFVSAYVPNGGKDYPAKLAFLREMRAYVASLHAAGKKVILCGDLNVARADIDVHPSQRKADAIGQRAEERELFGAILAEGLSDVLRVLHPEDERLFTWWPYWREARKRNIGWRIDYVLQSTSSPLRAVECNVLKDFGTSDHAPMVVVLTP